MFALAVIAIRSTVSFAFFSDFRQDPDAYRSLSESWVAHGIYGWKSTEGDLVPTAFRPPLYPWILHLFIGSDGILHDRSVAILHVLFGVATCVIAVRCAQLLMGFKSRIPWIVGACVAIDPILVRQSTLVMTETLATLLAVATWWFYLEYLASCAKAENETKALKSVCMLVLGFFLGLGALCRPTGLFWAGLWLIWMIGIQAPRFDRRKIVDGLLVLLGIGCFVVPWAFRNAQQMGRPIFMTSHGGYTLLLANNDSFYDHLRERGPSRDWDAKAFHEEWSSQSKESELAFDSKANMAAKEVIGRRPSMFLYSGIVRAGWLWALWPAESNGSLNASSLKGIVLRWAIGAWYAAWMLAGFYLAIRSLAIPKIRFGFQGSFSAWIPMLLLAISLTVVHSVYFSNMRMRAPMMPAIYAWCLIALRRSISEKAF